MSDTLPKATRREIDSIIGSDPGVTNIHKKIMDKVECAMLNHLFALTDGNKTAVAKMLGISRTTLYEMLRRHGAPLSKRIKTKLRRSGGCTLATLQNSLRPWGREEVAVALEALCASGEVRKIAKTGQGYHHDCNYYYLTPEKVSIL